MNTKHQSSPYQPALLWAFVAISFVLGLFNFASGFLGNNEKVVYVDSQKLVHGYFGMQEAKKEFEAKSKVWQANLDTLRSEAEVKIKEYESTANRLSASERQLMEQLIQAKQQQYMSYQEVVAEKIKQEDQALSTRVLSTVNDFIKQYGNEKGYTIIMAATQYGNIVFAKEDIDITKDVLNRLNEEFSMK